MDLNLSGQVAIVTGGASGIGRATVECFAAEGCSVAIWDLSEATGAAEEIASASGSRVIACPVDVIRQDQIDAALAATGEELGPVDHLVHAAAMGSGKFGFPFLNLDVDDWTKVIEVNAQGGARIVLGGTFIHNSQSFLKELGRIGPRHTMSAAAPGRGQW